MKISIETKRKSISHRPTWPMIFTCAPHAKPVVD